MERACPAFDCINVQDVGSTETLEHGAFCNRGQTWPLSYAGRDSRLLYQGVCLEHESMQGFLTS